LAVAIGVSAPRLENREKITGAILYTINLELPGMLQVKILRSQVPHARLLRVDATRAAALPGVRCVLTRDDLTKGDIDPYFGPVVRDQPILAIDKVRLSVSLAMRSQRWPQMISTSPKKPSS
jgi:CO/xanthine dehydrogenase Mo-binding subunit